MVHEEVYAREVSMAAANIRVPYSISGALFWGSYGSPHAKAGATLLGALGQPLHDACMAVSKQLLGGCYWQAVLKHRTCGVNKTASQLLPNLVFILRAKGRAKNLTRPHSWKKKTWVPEWCSRPPDGKYMDCLGQAGKMLPKVSANNHSLLEI